MLAWPFRKPRANKDIITERNRKNSPNPNPHVVASFPFWFVFILPTISRIWGVLTHSSEEVFYEESEWVVKYSRKAKQSCSRTSAMKVVGAVLLIAIKHIARRRAFLIFDQRGCQVGELYDDSDVQNTVIIKRPRWPSHLTQQRQQIHINCITFPSHWETAFVVQTPSTTVNVPLASRSSLGC